MLEPVGRDRLSSSSTRGPYSPRESKAPLDGSEQNPGHSALHPVPYQALVSHRLTREGSEEQVGCRAGDVRVHMCQPEREGPAAAAQPAVPGTKERGLGHSCEGRGTAGLMQKEWGLLGVPTHTVRASSVRVTDNGARWGLCGPLLQGLLNWVLGCFRVRESWGLRGD